MRILHVVHTPRFSGAEMLVLELTKLHAEMGHQSAVVAMFPTEREFEAKIEEQKTVGVEWFAPPVTLDRIARLKHLHRIQKKFSPDVTFAHSVLPAAYIRISGGGIIIPVLHAEDNYASTDLILSEYFLQLFSKGVIAVSPRSVALYAKRYKFPKIKCIPNGIELEKFRNVNVSNPSNLFTDLGLPSDAVIALQVGRLADIKQQYLSVRAIAPIIAANPKIHLLLAGLCEDPKSLMLLKNEIQLHKLDANVHLIGARSDVPTLLQIATVYLMPSKQESQGIALLEGIASGVQIVASDIAAFKYAEKMDGVVLIDPNDIYAYSCAITKAISNKIRYSRSMNEFDINITAKDYIAFAESFIPQD